jgi:DNA-binding SARP family transcriptional activator
VRQARTLHELYEEEHRRLADRLAFLTVQRRDLERELAAFDCLAATLESGALAPPRGSPIELPGPFHGAGAPGAPANRWSTVNGLEIRCLGGFEVRYQGRRVDLGTSRNGRLVFKYLVARAPARRASKEVLAELFWPETPLERALASLQSAVHQVRRAMASSEAELVSRPAIVYADDNYGLNPLLELRSDVDIFRHQFLEARALEARGQVEGACEAFRLAAKVYGGELLPDERYEDWVAMERASLEADQLVVLTRLVQIHLSRGAYLEAIQSGRHLLEVDSTREDVHRDVMRCYSRLGQRSEALRQYRRCFEALQAELELIPEAETTALFERLASGATI